MAQVEEVRERGKRHISTPMSIFPRDLLRRFISVNPLPVKLEEPSEDELQLTLGLSTNGRFGVDPKAKKMKRPMSMPQFIKPLKEEDMTDDTPLPCSLSTSIKRTTTSITEFLKPDKEKEAFQTPMPCPPLRRTCSLPRETQEECKKKELQSLKRLEAKRKRSEKQRNSEDAPTWNGFSGWGATSFSTHTNGIGFKGEKGIVSSCASDLPSSSLPQASNGFQGIGSLGISESQGINSPAAGSSLGPKRSPDGEQKPPVILRRTSIAENSGKNAAVTTDNEAKEECSSTENRIQNVRNVLDDIPCVATQGKGPNGKRTLGFLYQYGRGEEVRILCVCHGNFLTPAEFVKHAGGGDVSHPLKHIVVHSESFKVSQS